MTSEPIRWPRILPVLVTAGVTIVILAALILGLAQVYDSLRAILIPLLLAVAISYLLDPAVDWLVSRKMKRSNAVIVTVAGSVLILLLVAIVAAPVIGAQLVESAQKVPQAVSNTLAAIRPRLEHLHEVNPGAYEWILSKINEAVQHPGGLTEPLISSLSSAFAQFAHATSSLLDIVLIPFFVFYFLAEGKHWKSQMFGLVPPRRRAVVVELFEQLDRVVSNFIRGQLSVCGVMALFYILGFSIIRTPLPFALGVISGFAHLIPYVGTISAAVLTLALTGLESPSWIKLVAIIATYVGVQSLEGFVLTPRILGERLQLHPFVVILGILLGGSLFGMIGIILATPAVAILKALLRMAVEAYKGSQFYIGAEPDARAELSGGDESGP